MTAAEADQFVLRCSRVLPGWQREIDGAQGEAKADAQAARDSVLGTLMEIADDFPDKRKAIDEIAKAFAYGIWAVGSIAK